MSRNLLIGTGPDRIADERPTSHYLYRRPQCLDIAYWRLAEKSFVLPIELTRTLIPNLKGCARGIEFPRQHLLTRCVKPKLLLKLERTHGC